LFVPIIQEIFPFVKENPLVGVPAATPLPTFSINTWKDEQYQKNYLTAFEENIGFHNSLVRLRNQVNYSIFGFSDVADVVVGKDGYLFIKSYTNAYNGSDYLGREYINIQTQKLKAVQLELKKKNIDLFVILAPGKGSFYSEFIPDYLTKNIKPDSTNYSCYKKLFDENNVNYLDLKSYFFSIKSSEKYPLYSATSVHWTDYSCFLAGKQIVKYIESLRKIKLPNIKLQSVKMLPLTEIDYDAAGLMNIFTKVPHPSVAIPTLKFESDSTVVKPRFLCISDSYFFGLINTRIPFNEFANYHYWCYNDLVYPESFNVKTKVASLDLKKEIEKQDVICLLSTDATLSLFPFDFIDKAYELYSKKDADYCLLKKKEFQVSVLRSLIAIQNDKKWKDALSKNAKYKKISEAEELITNAIWVYEREQLKMKNE
jgi:hypothetical protein